MPSRRQLTVWALFSTALLGGWAIAFSLLALRRTAPVGHDASPGAILLATLGTAVAVAWAFAFSREAFRRLDEFQQQASRFAWYWGSAVGLAASAPLFAFIGLGGLHWLFPAAFHLGKDLFRAFAIGYALPLLFQTAGWMGAAAWWRLARG